MSEPVLKAGGLVKSFGAVVATDSVSLTLNDGEIHALIGPNGAGKSTLIKQITGELTQDSGSIEFAGKPLDGLTPQARARAGLGRSFQVSALMPEMSALQNVVLAAMVKEGGPYRFFRPVLAPGPLRDVAEAALDRVGLSTRAGARVAHLSHGERRQVEIAAALALGPRALLLDEPMAGMDPEGAARLTTLLEGLRHEAPILLVEHDMDAVFRLADRISVLVAGRIIAQGHPDEIRRDPAVRAAYLGDAP
ncbi:amino acid/amide ABC transporter ATP-binding protein 1, HAAT family [Poseidonocella pacifica]|uniref:Amino acid/amide ABC transporter ATP-binding protein 1, HAAT family n=1 Tax=Poseidonocella pacifica TaxID=871651 RepID=A0A1I0WGN9_9RHOB|nr:ABC transporter ATP-binding protein [Poseidonocella pacifica]SFA87734.1 amino acid/amide ABC transporter ATP-binding protein 1, HAAT family [Poseidonocella pacifica]